MFAIFLNWKLPNSAIFHILHICQIDTARVLVTGIAGFMSSKIRLGVHNNPTILASEDVNKSPVPKKKIGDIVFPIAWILLDFFSFHTHPHIYFVFRFLLLFPMLRLPSHCWSDIKPVFMILLNQSRNLWMTPLIAAEKLAIRALWLYLALYLLCISVSAFTLVLSYISSDWRIQSRLWTFFPVRLLYGQILFQSKHLLRVDSHRWEFPFSANSSEMGGFPSTAAGETNANSSLPHLL